MSAFSSSPPATRDLEAALTTDKFIRVGDLADLFDLVEIRLWIRKPYIVEDRAVKQEIILQHNAQMATIIAELNRLEILAVDSNYTG